MVLTQPLKEKEIIRQSAATFGCQRPVVGIAVGGNHGVAGVESTKDVAANKFFG